MSKHPPGNGVEQVKKPPRDTADSIYMRIAEYQNRCGILRQEPQPERIIDMIEDGLKEWYDDGYGHLRMKIQRAVEGDQLQVSTRKDLVLDCFGKIRKETAFSAGAASRAGMLGVE